MGPSVEPSGAIVRFGVFELDLQSGELLKHGRRVRLSGQPARILAFLVRRPGELITREELEQELWPGDTHVNFGQSLNAAVKRLRHVLGDSAENPRFIETMPRRGYRFIAPAGAAGSAPSRPPGRPRQSVRLPCCPLRTGRRFGHRLPDRRPLRGSDQRAFPAACFASAGPQHRLSLPR